MPALTALAAAGFGHLLEVPSANDAEERATARTRPRVRPDGEPTDGGFSAGGTLSSDA